MLFFFKQKTAYEMRISDWSSDVCSSDLLCPNPNPPFGRPDGSAALYWKDPPSASSRRLRSMRPDEYRWVASLDAETSQQNARHAPRCRWRFRALAPYPAEYRAALAQWHRDCAASRAQDRKSTRLNS